MPLKLETSTKNTIKLSSNSSSSLPAFLRKRSKKNLFELADDEDEEMNMTHNGRDINDMDAEELNVFDGGLDEHGNINPKLVGQMNFSGFDGPSTDNKRKTKKEILNETIKRSKLKKLENQKEQEENFNLKKRLDDEFSDLYGELNFLQQKKLKTQEEPEDDGYTEISRALSFEPRMPSITKIKELREQKEKEGIEKEMEIDSEEEEDLDMQDEEDYIEYEEGDGHEDIENELSERKFLGNHSRKADQLANNLHKTIGNLRIAADVYSIIIIKA